jgi:antitoxin VapB
MSATSAKSNAAPAHQAAQEASPKTAKLFKNGRSQAVRLPKEFRFEGNEVAIRRNAETGEVILTERLDQPALSFNEWLALYDAIPVDAPEEAYAKLPPAPGNLTTEQLFKIFDRTQYAEDFFERHTSMPRDLDLF